MSIIFRGWGQSGGGAGVGGGGSGSTFLQNIHIVLNLSYLLYGDENF